MGIENRIVIRLCITEKLAQEAVNLFDFKLFFCCIGVAIRDND
jgi:hypothetical protein